MHCDANFVIMMNPQCTNQDRDSGAKIHQIQDDASNYSRRKFEFGEKSCYNQVDVPFSAKSFNFFVFVLTA